MALNQLIRPFKIFDTISKAFFGQLEKNIFFLSANYVLNFRIRRTTLQSFMNTKLNQHSIKTYI